MAAIKHKCEVIHPYHYYIITNADNDWAEDLTDDTFERPGIKMTILETKKEIEAIFKPSDYDDGEEGEIFKRDVTKAVRGEMSNWKLAGVNIADEFFYLIYVKNVSASESKNLKYCCETVSCGDLDGLKILFEVDQGKDFPMERYEICWREHEGVERSGECYEPANTETTVTEYLGNRKQRKFEFNSLKDYYILTNYRIPQN